LDLYNKMLHQQHPQGRDQEPRLPASDKATSHLSTAHQHREKKSPNVVEFVKEPLPKEPLIKSRSGVAVAYNCKSSENAMRQITFACQPSFEKLPAPAAGNSFCKLWSLWFPGLSWKNRSTRFIPKQTKAATVGLGTMLRICFLQHRFNLSDPGAEDALYDSPALRRFAGADLGRAAAPDEAPSWTFATCSKSTIYAARFSIR